MEITINKRKLGMIMGALIGDALGSQYEFYSKNTIKQKYKENNNMIDFFTTPNYIFIPSSNIIKNTGELSDDGQLIMALIHHLQTDIKPSIKPYKEWFNINPDDMGLTIQSALKTGIPSDISQSNGPLMKVMPWLLLSDKLPIETLLRHIKIDCNYTHTNHQLLYNLLYYSICLFVGITNKEEVEPLQNFHYKVIDLIQDVTEKQYPELKNINYFTAEFAINNNKDINYLTNRGFCRIALLNAIYQLTHAESYEECIENTILQGGDTDTNACIAGALYGAVYGIDMIPKKWQDIVKNAKSSLGSKYEPYNIEELINNINKKDYSLLQFYQDNLITYKTFKISNIVNTILSKQNEYKIQDNGDIEHIKYDKLYNLFINNIKYNGLNYMFIDLKYMSENLLNYNPDIVYMYTLLKNISELKDENKFILIPE